MTQPIGGGALSSPRAAPPKTEVAIAFARAGRVLGEMAVLKHHLAAGGGVGAAAIVAFAGEIVARGMAVRHGTEQASATIESKVSVFSSRPTDTLVGDSTALGGDGDLVVWQTAVSDPSGRAIAAVLQTERIASGTDPAPVVVRTTREQATPAASSVAGQRRAAIVDAACEIIARKGFASATTREIAEAAGLHVPTMYQYVGSKDEMLELVYESVMERLRAEIDEAAAGHGSAREELRAILDAMLANGDRYRRQVGVLNRELRSLPPASRERVLARYRAFLDRIGAIVARGVASGEFRPVEPALVANFIEALAGIWPLRQFSVGTFTVAEFRSEVAGFIDCALSAEPLTRPA